MTRIIATPKCLLVEVPEGAHGFYLSRVHNEIWFKINGRVVKDTKLPEPSSPASYGEPVLASEANEAQAAQVVQIISTGKLSGRPQYRKYDDTTNIPARMWTRDARHSLETLLRAHSLKPETIVVIPIN